MEQQNKKQIISDIYRLKKEKDVIILAHNYQLPEVQDIADFLGDSLELARIAEKAKEKLILFCGVRFMAETAKILSPAKKVLIPVSHALCPMAETVKPEDVLELKKQYPDAVVVSYVNTNADVKAVTDICCTSANAITVVKNIKAKRVIFTPDINLAWWVQNNLPHKEIIPWHGFCYVHQSFQEKDLNEARNKHPQAEIVVHPECPREILMKADKVFSTSGMLKYVKEANAKEFIIGTEEGIIYRMKKDNPDKKFYSLGPARTCLNMKKIRLENVLQSLLNEQYEINLPEEIIRNSRKSLEEMVKYI